MLQEENTTPEARRRYKPGLGADARRHTRDINKAIEQTIKNYKAQHAGELSKLRILKPAVEVRVRSPGSPQMLKMIIQRILTSEGANATQAWIRRSVETLFPDRAVYKDWGHPLPAYAHKHAVSLLPTSEPAFRSLVIPRRVTLRELHKLAKLAHAKHDGKARTYRARITVSEEAVFINGEAFLVSTSRAGKYTYRFFRVTLTTLENILGTASIEDRGSPNG